MEYPAINFDALALKLVDNSVSVDILKERTGDCRVVRIQGAATKPIIAKLWNRPGWRGFFRYLTRTTPGQKEYRSMRKLHQKGVNVPYAFKLINIRGREFTQILFQEDMGECIRANEYVSSLIEDGKEKLLNEFLNEIIEMTALMVEDRVIDPDHSFLNIVVTSTGKPARLDLELAVSGWRHASKNIYGKMIGRLVGSYCFAVEQDTTRVVSFALMLADALKPPLAVLKIADKNIESMMQKQKHKKGIATNIDIPWTTRI